MRTCSSAPRREGRSWRGFRLTFCDEEPVGWRPVRGAQKVQDAPPPPGPTLRIDGWSRPRRSRIGFAPGRRSSSRPRRRRSYPGAARWSRSPTARCARRFSATATGSSTRKAFRRLKHKTQVFVAPEGDHYRTRLTHTLEACGIARTVARALGLNEDLTEAIGLGHDLGHPPFGHIGEEALDAALRERCDSGFKHNEHSLRVVDVLERDGRGLNLTEQVRDGILNHTGSSKPATLEGRIVKLVDRVAYINHDIDDALRAGVLRPDDLPAAEIELLGADRLGADRHPGPRHRRALPCRRGTSPRARRSAARCCACASSCSTASTWGRRRGASTSGCTGRCAASSTTTWSTRTRCRSWSPAPTTCQRVTDYLAGMTDRYCIAKFTELTIPEEAARWR